MESFRYTDQLPDNAMKTRVKQAGAVGVSALAIMGATAIDKMANAEVQSNISQALSAKDLHGVRGEGEVQDPVILSVGEESSLDVIQDPLVESQDDKRIDNEKETHYHEPAQWWPTAVKQNWLLIQSKAQEYELDPYLVATIVAEESGGQNINNPSGATGLMQIMPSTAQEIARLRNRTYYNMSDPTQNLDYGCWLIQYIDEKYIGANGVDITTDMGLAMLAVGYGDGEGALQVWMNNGYQTQHLSDQAKHVTPLWTDMYHNRNNLSSNVYTQMRGANNG